MSALNQERASLLVRFLDLHFALTEAQPPGQRRLYEAIRYSLLQEGGKRFRPVLAMLTAEALGFNGAMVLPYAAAVECVHTYSLIHDDLPAMDNDDLRRGQPTNHRQFDEATAILAGDALLTEAFGLITESFSAKPTLALAAIAELSRAAGARGMVGGQAIDMAAKKDSITVDELRYMHHLKTGALIRSAVRGAAILCDASLSQLDHLTIYAEAIGLAFQIADDILDHNPEKPEAGSYPSLLGMEKTNAVLDQVTRTALEALAGFDRKADDLREIARYNQTRLV